MPYNINKYDGTLVAVVEDGTVDSTLDISLIGRNYAGYGEVQNENIVHLLENFASGSEPPKKITGQIWYDTRVKKLKFFDGNKFKSAGGTEIGDLKPSGLSVGDFWYNTDTNQLYSCSGDDNFVLIGPQAVQNALATELKSTSVDDKDGDPQPIIKGVIDAKVVFIISKTAFELDPVSKPADLAEFTIIKKGITLASTPSNGVSTNDYVYWGTASNAIKLNGFSSTDFVRTGSPLFDKLTRFLDEGFTLGNNNDLAVFISDTNTVIKNNSADKSIIFKTTANVLGGGIDEKIPLKLQGLAALPGSENSTIGSSDSKFKNIYAVNFNGALSGNATSASQLLVDGTNRSAATGATANTVAVRDNNGDITARRFIGAVDKTDSINGGSAGAIVYQSSPNLTSFLAKGTAKQVLAISDSNDLAWTSLSGLIGSVSVNAESIDVTNTTDANTTHYITFTSGKSNSELLRIDDDVLTYNPGTNTLTCANFNGTASNATKADRIGVTNTSNDNATHYITFTSGKTNNETLRIDDDALTYNPRTNTLTCANFDGTASKAKFADLAEKYLSDKEYDIGTVLMIGGDKEVTAAQVGFRAIGVVSENPAYLMNNGLENGIAVALKGRVPIKVSGSVIKGQRLVAAPNGTAQAFGNHNDTFAIALETNIEAGIKLVECLVL